MKPYEIRSRSKSPFWKTALFCVMFLILGAAAGVGSKLADVYSEIFGNITSAMGVWIFICVTICAFSKSPFRAAAYVFLFCAAMIAGYYLTAEFGELYYSRSFVKAGAFSRCLPRYLRLLHGMRGARENCRGFCVSG